MIERFSRLARPLALVVAAVLTPASVTAQQPQPIHAPQPDPGEAQRPQPMDLERLAHGASPFPLLWKPYRPEPLPPADLRNGSLLRQHLVEGTVGLSVRDFLRLVVDNNLDLHSARVVAGDHQAPRHLSLGHKRILRGGYPLYTSV